MPMLYGEGSKAFLRLQEQTIKQSDDHSIFAWPIYAQGQPGLLADTPEAFANCAGVRAKASRRGRPAFASTNRGLSITLAATMLKTDTYLVRLDCVDHNMPFGGHEWAHLGMLLMRLDEDDQFARVTHQGATFLQPEASTWDNERWQKSRIGRPVLNIQINVRQSFSTHDPRNQLERIQGFRLVTSNLLLTSKSGKDMYKITAPSWAIQERIMSIPAFHYGFVGSIDIGQQGQKIRLIKLGFDFDYNPMCFVAMAGGQEQPTHFFDGKGQFNFRLDSPVTQWTKERLAQFPSIHERSPLDMLAWNTIGRKHVSELKLHPGLWALKGDRINGLDVSLGGLARVKIERAGYQGRLI